MPVTHEEGDRYPLRPPQPLDGREIMQWIANPLYVGLSPTRVSSQLRS